MNILLATKNIHKAQEISVMLGNRWEVTDLNAPSCQNLPDIAETGKTFEENASLKATGISRLLPGVLVLSDDSGLEVDALDGEPGVRSARYAGQHGNDAANNAKLLAEMAGQENRSACFRCVMALARSGKLLATFPGKVQGTLLGHLSGKGGFGYDPLFVPDGYHQTFAQLGDEVKNTLSHRRRALEKTLTFLRSGAF